MFYNRTEAMETLAITAPTLYDFVRRGLLTIHKQGNGRSFFLKTEVDNLAKERMEIKPVVMGEK